MVITDDDLELSAAPELLSRARAGDTPAFCLLIEPLQTRLLRQAAALSGDLSAAEDLVSETLVEAWKSLARYNATCQLSTWLYAILLHRYQKSVRRARSRPISLARLSSLESEELHEQQQNVPSTDVSPAEQIAQAEAFALAYPSRSGSQEDASAGVDSGRAYTRRNSDRSGYHAYL